MVWIWRRRGIVRMRWVIQMCVDIWRRLDIADMVMDGDIRMCLWLYHTLAPSASASLYVALAHIPSRKPGLAEQTLKRSMRAESMFWFLSARLLQQKDGSFVCILERPCRSRFS